MAELAYLTVFFILHLAHAASNMRQLKNKLHRQEDTFSNNGAREMEFGSLDDRNDWEYNSVGFVEISGIFAMQDEIVYGAISFDRVWR